MSLRSPWFRAVLALAPAIPLVACLPGRCLAQAANSSQQPSEQSAMKLSVMFYDARVRLMATPPALRYGEGFIMAHIKWNTTFTDKDHVRYRVWVEGKGHEWASANTLAEMDESGSPIWRQYVYASHGNAGGMASSRVKMEFGYRPEGLTAFPLTDKGPVKLPAALPLPPGKYPFTICVERTGPGERKELARKDFEITISGDPASSLVINGISDGQVFQRSSKQAGEVTFQVIDGAPAGQWQASVTKDGQTIINSSGSFSGAPASFAITDVPVGGPYEVRFSTAGKTRTFNNIYVGDLWIISGQSNAVGTGGEQSMGAKPMPGVQCLEPRYGIREWTVARDGFFEHTVGAWVTAAQMFYQETGVPVGMMGIAQGSTPITWFLTPDGSDIYSLRPLIEKHGKKAAVFLWYQGESDFFLGQEARDAYRSRLKLLTDKVREAADNPQMMVGICQLGKYGWHKDDHFAVIREAQRQFVLTDPNSVLYATIPYDIHQGDKIHLLTHSYIALGRQVGAQMIERERSGELRSPGPVLEDVYFTRPDRRQIAVAFTNAQGLSGQEAADEWFVKDSTHRGFRDGGFVKISKVTINAEGQRVLLDLESAPQGDAAVCYAYRCDVGGSLVNGAGYPAAAFVDVPVALSESR